MKQNKKLVLFAVCPACYSLFMGGVFCVKREQLQHAGRQKQGGTPFCRTLKIVFPKNCSCKTLHLGKPPESGCASPEAQGMDIRDNILSDFPTICGKAARFFRIFLKIIPIFHRISVRFSGFLPNIQTFNFVFNNLWKENTSRYAIF